MKRASRGLGDFQPAREGLRNGFSHFAVKAEAQGKLLDARVLHGDVPPPYSGGGATKFGGFGFGVARETLSGLPHFRHTEFRGGFPFAEIAFRDPAFPGRVTLTAFNPLIPLNGPGLELPAAFFTIAIRNDSRQTIDYTVAFTVRNPAQKKSTDRLAKFPGATLLHLTGDLDPAEVKFGDFAVATDRASVATQEYLYRGGWFDTLGVYWQDFTTPGKLEAPHLPDTGPRRSRHSGGADASTGGPVAARTLRVHLECAELPELLDRTEVRSRLR